MNTTLRENIDWVGHVDWNVRDFHGYNTDRGATYNAYLVRDAKTALVDTVKGPFAGRLLARVAALVDLSRVDYVVSNHAEPDHAGALPEVMQALPNATLVADAKCLAALAGHFDTSGWKTRTIADGETLSLGRRTLRFIETPMVHWPESMFTYVAEERLLFSMDAFGQHYASSGRFDDEVPVATILDEAKTYYANIVMPYGKQVARVLQQTANLPIDMIAPAHGVIWRSHVPAILRAYADWSVCRRAAKVVVIYDTMWGSTGEMAEAIHEGASRPGVEAVLLNIRRSNLTRLATEMLDAATVAFGSPTLNGGMMPMAAAVLAYLKGLRPVGKAGFAFGSYGWGVGGPEAISEHLAAMKWEIPREPLKARYRPTAEVLAEKARQMAG
ncbi:MAG: FprA family A-type flavoprotein [Planctomycetia bacterium]|nr:FprA family A-type flavoprotein [Planctomycetia bacterium]